LLSAVSIGPNSQIEISRCCFRWDLHRTRQ